MKKFYLCLLILFFSVFASQAVAYEPIVSKHVLEENGLTVVIQEMPNNPMVSVYMMVKAGSATEGKYLGCGLSHFLEHMLFKGTGRRGPGEIAAEIQAVGGNLNASTSLDFTIYTINVPYQEFDVGLDVLADMVLNSVLDPEEVRKEREVVFNEMRMVYDRPDRYLSKLAFKTVYTQHPYMHPVIGYKDLLAQVTRDEMMEYYKSRYFPNNMVLAVAGNVKADEVLPKIKEMFKSYPRKPYISSVVPQEPDQISPRRVEDTYETDLTQISIAYPSVGMLEHDLYALDVLAQILGQGESSRLFKSLIKDKKLVQYVSATNFTPVDQGVFEVEAVFEDESKAEEVIDESLQQIELIKTKGITKNELKKTLQQVLRDYIFSNQTTERVAWTLSYDEAFTGNHQFSANYVKEVGKVTADDIKRVANKYLTRNKSNIIVLRPKKGQGVSEVKKADVTAGEIKKEVLPNGLVILTREDPQFEVVSIRLNLRGGLYEEPSNINGTALLMADVWTKGTKSRTAEQIAELTDSKGIALSGSSGRNSNGIYLDCLSQDWELCMDLLKEVALSPAFPQEEIDLMKQQYSMSLKYRDKDIFRLASFHLQQNLFDTHPLRLDTRGTEDSLARISRDDLVNFYKRIVVPNNMVISVFGNVDAGKVTEKIKKDFGRLERRDIQLNSFTEKALEAPRQKSLTLEKEQAIIQYGFRGVSFNNPEYYALDVLTSVLGSSFSGRMFTKIRDTYGKAYTLGGDVVASVDAGYVFFYVLTDDKSIEDVDRLVREEIKKIQTELVSEQELQDIKRYMKGIQKSGLQTNAQQNSTSSLNELYHLGYNYHLHYDEYVDKVSREDVREAANKYLDLQKMVTIYVRPQQKAAVENEADIIKGNE